MIRLKQAVIVEGKYDKIKLSQFLDAVIIATNGFGIYRDKEKTAFIRQLAGTCGIIILTDSDHAGLRIRNHLKGCISDGEIINVYIPQIKGKEKRKENPSAEGYLGVEGISDDILKDALAKAGVISEGNYRPPFIDKARLMDDGLIGMNNSSELRKKLLNELKLPDLLSTSSMLEILNRIYTLEEYENAISKI